jgi:hypothetical protein
MLVNYGYTISIKAFDWVITEIEFYVQKKKLILLFVI